MAAWKKAEGGGGGGKYLKFEAGAAWEGVYNGCKEKPNPFHNADDANSPKMSADYFLEIDGEEHILSSAARTLRDQLMSLAHPCKIKLECVQQGIKKWYQVWIEGEEEQES